MKSSVTHLFCRPDDKLRHVLGVMNSGRMGVAMVVDDEGRLKGIVVDGDIRRAFLKGATLETTLDQVYNRHPMTVAPGLGRRQYIDALRSMGVRVAPVVDEDGRVVDCLHYSSLLSGTGPGRNGVLFRPSPSNGETVLVTGGGGYIGSILVRQLLADGYHVRVLDHLAFGREPLAPVLDHPNFELAQADMLDVQTMIDSVFGCRYVIHLAAIVGDPACAIDSASTIANNYFAVKTLADVARHYHVERFVFASSCSVYGAMDDEFLTESSWSNPVSLYAETRLESEKDILKLAADDFSPVVLRLGTVYGLSPRMRFDLVVNLLTALAVSKGEINIFGGDQWRPFVHCEDIARAFALCLKAPREKIHGMVFNVGNTEENYRLGQIGDHIARIVPGTVVNHREAGADKRNYRVSFELIKEVLGYESRRRLHEGIEEIATSMRQGQYQDFTASRYSNFKTQDERFFAE